MQNIHTPAQMDVIHKGHAFGGVASTLLANNMDVAALRTNTTLRKDEWKKLDETVVQISRDRLVGVNELVSRGLVYDLGGQGLGITVLETETESDMEAAQVSMDGVTRGRKDKIEYEIGYLPLPVTHKEFSISARKLAASRRGLSPLDTTQAGIATRKVAEMNEQLLFQGSGTYTFGGGTIYGLLDHPDINTVAVGTDWNDSGATGATILANVLAAKQALMDVKHYGPYGLWVAANWETKLDEDFKDEGDITIRQRLLQVEGIEFVKVADYLTDDNAVLVELAPETIRMVIGLQPTTVEWDIEGGMATHFKVMDIIVPQIRSDQDSNCGVAVIT